MITSAAEPRCNDGAEMGANLKSESCPYWLRQGCKPSFDAHAQSCRAFDGLGSVLWRSLRQPEQKHRAVSQKAGDHSSRTHCLLVDQRMKFLQQLTDRVRSKPLAERGEAGQIDENYRGILAHRLLEEIWVTGEPFLNVRRLELFQQFASRGEILRPPPARPELHRCK